MEDSQSTLIGEYSGMMLPLHFTSPRAPVSIFLRLNSCRCDDVVPGAPVTVSDSLEDASCVVLGLLNDSRQRPFYQ
jgi:hypothetical protein